MNKIQILLGLCLALSSEAMASEARAPKEAPSEKKEMQQEAQKLNEEHKSNKSAPELVKSVEEALSVLKKDSPQVHEDALRVWKNFDAQSKPVNFTYRFWGRRLILWLKDHKKMVFDSEEKVGEVFKILWRKGLISKNAVVVLTVDSWGHLIYLEGEPAWEKRRENQRSGGREAGTLDSHKDAEASKREQAV